MNEELKIGLAIKENRERLGFSREIFASMMGVSAQAVGKWERGESLPDIITLKSIANTLSISLDEILSSPKASSPSNEHKKPHINMSAAYWKNADFSSLNGIEDKFKCSNVENCKFCSCELKDVTFSSNNLKNCDFTDANLSNAKLNACNLQNNNFANANLKGMTIKMCNIKQTSFDGADLTNAKLSFSNLKATFKNARLISAEFSNCRIIEASFSGKIKDCTFVNCTYKNVAFLNAIITNTFFKGKGLKNASFTNCKADKISLSFIRAINPNVEGIELIES